MLYVKNSDFKTHSATQFLLSFENQKEIIVKVSAPISFTLTNIPIANMPDE